MRTLVDIPESQIQAIQALTERSKLSRAEIIRRAIAAYLERHQAPGDEAFGLWQVQAEDGVAYQERVRAEW